VPSRNEAVLAYLETERVAEPGTTGPWVKDGYSLATHPDLCERVEELNDATGRPAELEYLYGKPTLVTADGVVVAFGGGTYVLAVRLPADEIDERLHGKIHDNRARLEALTSSGWTLVDPWAIALAKREGLEALADLIRRAVAS
jgi:hypothetical protein